MKKLILLALSAASMAAYALPTYEPFTEYAALITAGGGSVDLGTSGFYLTNGPVVEQWGGGSSGFGLFFSQGTPTATAYQEILVTNIVGTVFTTANLASILPANFPGAGSDITNAVYIPQNSGANTAGNSALLKFAHDIPRPTNGVTTIYVSYLLDAITKGTTVGAGNNGRYVGFLSQTNIYEGRTNGVSVGGAYNYWTNLFNTFGSTTYAAYGMKVSSPTINNGNNILPTDSSAGNAGGTGNAGVGVVYNTANFVVGCYTLSANGSDTNRVWVNPPVGDFGGATPSASNFNTYKMVTVMSDVNAFFIESRSGAASGGNSPSFLGNLLIGTTWSYVTGGPEFTNQPTSVNGTPGGTVSFKGDAVAAGQSVSYHWQHIVGSTTNVLTDGVGSAGGGATVSGSGTDILTLTGITAGDWAGTYQLLATASGTGFSLGSQTASIITDPTISSNPASTNLNYGGTATFTVTASTALGSMSYQWYLGSTPLADGLQASGSTVAGSSGTVSGSSLSTTLTVANVSYLDTGNYHVVVTNNVNNANASGTATLTVNDPYFISQPNGNPLVLNTGGTGSISVSVAGTGVTYQWYGVSHGLLSNGGDLSGVSSATLTIANAQSSDADNYYCVVSGASGQTLTTISTPVYVESSALGPFNQNDWPPIYAQNASVDYAIWDPGWLGTYPASPWNNDMSIAASSGDQTWTTTTIGGGTGYQMTGSYLSIINPNWRTYTNVPVIDILLNCYGNGAGYDASGNPLATTLREGQLATGPTYVHQGAWPLGSNNGQWNWVLLTFTNPIDGNGYRYVGDPTVSSSGGANGGVNNSTVSLYAGSSGFGPNQLIVRAVAMGPHGAFGASNQVNRFAAPAACMPEPTNNLAWIDFNQGTSNNLSVMNNPGLGEIYTVQSGVGPVGDQRTAIQSSGLMEMPILNNYLGYPCNQNLSCQVCFELYDDPALAGETFGPLDYATDYQGDLQAYTGNPYTLTGSGQWIKVCFFVGPLNLNGVNTAPLTGGPLMQFNGTAPYIDRVEVGLIRTGTNKFAGQIPDPDYHLNPFICGTNYGYYAEWNPTDGTTTNVTVSSGYTTTLAGPASDQRTCEVPNAAGGGYYYEDWNLLNQVFGPNYQDNADVIMNVTYYDDPALTGVGITNGLFPNLYSTMVNGSVGLISPTSPYGQPVIFQGTGKWQVAQFELPDVNFTSGGSQHVCRFASSAPVYISRVQFNVLRPCGNFEGIDYLQALGMNNTNAQINLSWRGQATVQGAPAVAGAYGAVVSVTNTINNVYSAPMTNPAEFFRLQTPGYPTNLPGDNP